MTEESGIQFLTRSENVLVTTALGPAPRPNFSPAGTGVVSQEMKWQNMKLIFWI
jgi:hypothetical protein